MAIAEAFVFSIRACGNTLCVGPLGHALAPPKDAAAQDEASAGAAAAGPAAQGAWGPPHALRRLWCCAEVYISVCVGAQCAFALPPAAVAALEGLVASELPQLTARVVRGVDVSLAECGEADSSASPDRSMLLKWLRSGHRQWGIAASPDLRFVNRALASALRSFLAQTARRVMATGPMGAADRASVEMGAAALTAARDRAEARASVEAASDGASLSLMAGYAMLLEEQGRGGVGSGRGWCFKMAVIWFLKVCPNPRT